MGWTLKAEGQVPDLSGVLQHTPEAEHERIEGIERELYERLREVLSNPKYGTVTATLSGDEILGWPGQP